MPPSKLEKETHLSSEVPQYTSAVALEPSAGDSEVWETVGKRSTPCYLHGASQTPHLDVHLSQHNTKARMHALSSALADTVNDNCCTKCAIKSSAHTVTVYLRDMKATRKNGQWSSAEKKALKAEVKGLYKEMKRDLKKVWKTKPQA